MMSGHTLFLIHLNSPIRAAYLCSPDTENSPKKLSRTGARARLFVEPSCYGSGDTTDRRCAG